MCLVKLSQMSFWFISINLYCLFNRYSTYIYSITFIFSLSTNIWNQVSVYRALYGISKQRILIMISRISFLQGSSSWFLLYHELFNHISFWLFDKYIANWLFLCTSFIIWHLLFFKILSKIWVKLWPLIYQGKTRSLVPLLQIFLTQKSHTVTFQVTLYFKE